jgi:hypothetical protein
MMATRMPPSYSPLAVALSIRGRAASRLPIEGPPRAPDISALASAVNAAVRFSVFAMSVPFR